MLTDKNYWATYKDSIHSWYGVLPSPAELGIERVFEFLRLILDTADREQVMRVVESPSPWRFKSEDGWTWLEYVRAYYEREGHFPLFPGGGPTRQTGGRVGLPARLAYYKGERIVEEDIEDVGALKDALCMGKDGEDAPWTSTPAIDLNGGIKDVAMRGGTLVNLPSVPGVPPTGEMYVHLNLDTDIWFPRVVGLGLRDDAGPSLEGPHPALGRDGLMDNSALAARHTPRLNRLVETLHDAVLELGGQWEMDTNPSYRPMVHDRGILLDYPAASA